MAFTQGENVETDDYLALFTTLEEIRAKHVAMSKIISDNKKKLQDTTLGGNTAHGVDVGVYAEPDNVSKVKKALAFIETYAVDLSGFSSSISVPEVDTLLKAGNLSTAKTKIDAAKKVCANCSFNSSVQSFNSSADGFNSSNNGSWNSSWNGVVC